MSLLLCLTQVLSKKLRPERLRNGKKMTDLAIRSAAHTMTTLRSIEIRCWQGSLNTSRIADVWRRQVRVEEIGSE